MARQKGELTLAILDEAVKKIEQLRGNKEIIGFKVNPDDLASIKSGTGCIWALDNNLFFVTPPYDGVYLVSDDRVPPGYPEAIRREEVDG